MLLEVTLTPRLEAYVNELTASGTFSSTAEIVAIAIERMHAADVDSPSDPGQLQWLKAMAAEGAKSSQTGVFHDGDAVLAALESRIQPRTVHQDSAAA